MVAGAVAAPDSFVIVNVSDLEPEAEGTPEITPVLEFNVSPEGNAVLAYKSGEALTSGLTGI